MLIYCGGIYFGGICVLWCVVSGYNAAWDGVLTVVVCVEGKLFIFEIIILERYVCMGIYGDYTRSGVGIEASIVVVYRD